MLRLLRILFLLLALVVLLAFGYMNFQSTWVDLYWTRTEAPLVVVLAIAFVAGAVVMFLMCAMRLMRMRAHLSSTRRRLKSAESKLERSQQGRPPKDR